MSRRHRLLRAGCAVLLATSGLGLTGAAGPAAAGDGQIQLRTANGFVAAGERITPDGAVVSMFRSGSTTVSVIGRPGSSVSLHASPGSKGRPGTLQVSMSTTRPKSATDAAAYGNAGRSVIGDLVALGMPREQAEREFGELATLTAGTQLISKPIGAAGAGTLESTATQATAIQAGVTPYDTQCAAINVAGGKITGYGCSTFFLVHQSGADWWLMTKMKVSAHSNDGSWFSPKRLTQLGWRVVWGAGNVLHDWDPYSTQPVGSCATVTVKSISPWAEVSVQGNVCPDSLGPWAVTTARSGGVWNGMERGTDYEGALATQAVHSPPGAAVAFQSAWTLSYCDLWCN